MSVRILEIKLKTPGGCNINQKKHADFFYLSKTNDQKKMKTMPIDMLNKQVKSYKSLVDFLPFFLNLYCYAVYCRKGDQIINFLK